MTPEERRYLFVQSPIGSGVVNALLNAAIGWGVTRGMGEFPIWQIPGVAVDLVATAFGVAFGTCLGAVLQVRLDLKSGRITVPTDLSPRLSASVARLPRSAVRRAFVLGLACVPLFVPVLLLGLALSGASALGIGAFITLKAALSGALGALVTPLVVLAALRDAASPSPR